jgi:hypothetical protein
MKISSVALLAAAITLAVIAEPATARADDDYQMFQSPSGNIRCHIDSQRTYPTAMCQLGSYTYPAPPASSVACESGANPGRLFRLVQGQPGQFGCNYAALDSGYSGPWPTLGYGQTRSAGAVSCDSEPTGVTCRDSSTGHFFRISRESYQLG